MIYTIGIALTFFLSLILFTKRGKSLPDKILMFWLLVVLLHLILFSIISSGKYLRFTHFLGLEIPLPLLHGPFLYLYTAALVGQHQSLKKSLLHFIPSLLGFAIIFPFLFLKSQSKIEVYLSGGQLYAQQTSIIFMAIIVSGLTYSIASFYRLRVFQKNIKNEFSYFEKINLRWLQYLIIGLSGIWIIALVANDTYIFTAVVLYVLYIGYFGVKQVGIFTNQAPQTTENQLDLEVVQEKLNNPVKYEKSLLAEEQLETIYANLRKVMEEKKLYLDPELTLNILAQELNIQANVLSQVINRVEQMSFFDYVNKYRVEEVMSKMRIPENRKFTLLSLAFESGFNSKTSFNRNFKKVTGLSPKDYFQSLI